MYAWECLTKAFISQKSHFLFKILIIQSLLYVPQLELEVELRGSPVGQVEMRGLYHIKNRFYYSFMHNIPCHYD